jgi:hypothetical protein
MLPKGPSPQSQQHTTCPYPEPYRSSPYPPPYFLKVYFNIILPPNVLQTIHENSAC